MTSRIVLTKSRIAVLTFENPKLSVNDAAK